MPTTIDLRSDTVTQPSPAMRGAMMDAAVGDDVYDQDPTIHRLQHVMAEQFGFEDALFFPTGTQSNLAALLAHCQRGEEYIVGQEAHTYKYEGGGAAVLGSIQPQPLLNQADGSIALADIEAAIKPDDIHFARTKLIALENTIGGRVLPMAYMAEVKQLADRRGLAVHLDGARVFNAAVKLGLSPADVCKGLDSVSVCLSKGLGTPAGSVLCGSKTLIKDAKRWRKMLGGGMRQVGILAAAGLYALEHNVQRLADDHENASLLAAGLAEIDELRVEPVQTNIVFVHVAAADIAPLSAHLSSHGIVASVGQRTRLVTHLDVSAEQVRQAVQVFKAYFTSVKI
ncbi:low-specificity L-threonine aldolase [Undibacterium sp.]|uniref:low-specificity L-threonine aldolase n=1 Tax=Undibacterium sp. TaxID=1914977 RepID=UPI00374D213B